MSDILVVSDTNVVISAHHGNANSPAREIFRRWESGEFTLLYSEDILAEYVEKLFYFGVPEDLIERFVITLEQNAVYVSIDTYHHRKYPVDPDDIAFVLCADNGYATDLISYDQHLLDLQGVYAFDIIRPIEFLQKLREQDL